MALLKQPPTKLPISDQRMLQLIDNLKATGVITYRQEFCDALGISKQLVVNIRNGGQSFTVKQIQAACEKYGVNANWVLGLERQIFRVDVKRV